MELGIVTQIRNLAKDAAYRTTIVKDQGCLPGLVLFLDNKSIEVVDLAVEALSLLAESAENKPTMWKELGLVISLNAVIATSSLSPATHAQARSIVDAISPRLPQASGRPSLVPADAFGARSRTVTLQIKGLDDLVEEQLLAIKGVVSFTFDMKLQRTDIRARSDVAVETLCGAISKTKTMTASQVVRTEAGKEVVLSFGRGPAEKENAAPPKRTLKYLDEDEPVPEAVVSSKAVARVGDAGQSGGWFGSIGTYLSKSLYW